MSRRTRWWLAGAGAVVAAGLLLPAAADWLVTRDGSRIETDGPWRVDDRLIVFKQKDGSLSSIRRSAIDLEASERLTREMSERVEAPPPPPPPPKAVLRLTEKDLPPVGARPAAGEDDRSGTAPEADGTAAEEEGGESLQVTSWREVRGPAGAGIEFVGEVRNVTGHTALAVSVDVLLFDEQGEEIETARAVLTSAALPPGETAGFRASFPDVYQYARMELRSTGRLVRSDPESEPGDGSTP